MNTADNTATLETRLRELEAQREGAYDKRTEHLDAEGRAIFINRLIEEDSPYLLQHAHNPVNWYPWGDEAFAAAKAEDKPIFLSIGYSTCHWCHVMEVESFDNVEVAKLLNQHFISIKMDREQFPDLDEIYMTGVQLVSGHGGWPMSNFLLPDGRPFYGATYFPAPSFMQVLGQIGGAWHNQRSELERNAHSLYQAINKILCERKPLETLRQDIVDNAVKALLQREDRSLGGLAGAPKFPQEPILLFLLDQVVRRDDGAALGFVERTLEGMGRGGIYDQVGGGFHRYSVDEEWLIPHFEKMLYNQAQLALVYTRAYALTQKPRYRHIAEQTIHYLLRDMQYQPGGFFSAMDADSQGEEGRYYTWEIDTIKQILSDAQWNQFSHYFDLSNYTEFEQRHVIRLKTIDELNAQDWVIIQQLSKKLLHYRKQQQAPLIDEKIILSWNALIIPSLLEAAQTFNNAHYKQQALALADYLVSFKKNNQYYRIRINEQLQTPALLEDYAYLANAYLHVFDVTQQSIWLDRAIEAVKLMNEKFWDKTQSSFNLNVANPYSNYQQKISTDDVIPSGNSAAYQALIKLSQRTTNTNYLTQANQLLGALSTAINQDPINHTNFITTFDDATYGALSNTQYLYQGRVMVTSQLNPNNQAHIKIQLAPNWHINAHQPLQKSLIGTQVENLDPTNWSIIKQQYPVGKVKQLGFSKDVILIYENSAEIMLELKSHSSKYTPPKLALELQACSDQICLPPSRIKLKL